MTSVISLLGLGAVVGVWYLAFHEPGRVMHRTLDLYFESLPPAFDGYRILHLSDLHFRWRDRQKTRYLLGLGRHEHDLCVITGDLIETDHAVKACCEAVAGLRARDGVFAVLGNHDYYRYSFFDMFHFRDVTHRLNDVDRLTEALGRAGVRVMRNEHTVLRRGEDALWLAAVDDPVTLRDDLDRTFRGVPADAFVLLLAHSPDILKTYRKDAEHLVLAGHTHGGQISLPLYGPLFNHSSLEPGFVSGRMEVRGGTLLVTNGLGVNRFFPFRFRCRPEVHTLRLHRGQAPRQEAVQPPRTTSLSTGGQGAT